MLKVVQSLEIGTSQLEAVNSCKKIKSGVLRKLFFILCSIECELSCGQIIVYIAATIVDKSH